MTQEQRKLADVLIHTDLGKYTSSDFSHGHEIAELGEQSARKQLNELQALADKIRATRPLLRSEPHSLLAQFQELHLEDVVVQEVTLHDKELSIYKHLQQEEDAPLDPDLIERAVETIFSTGHYESVKFSLEPGTTEHGRILTSVPARKSC